MPSNHLESLGFVVENEEEFIAWIEQAVKESEEIVTDHGSYLFWSPGNGIELWLQMDENHTFHGYSPHFAGESRVPMGLAQRVQPRPDAPMSGGFYGWVNGQIEDGDVMGDTPFIFEAPDYDFYADLELPVMVDVQVTAFAHEAHIFAEQEEMAQSDKLPLPLAEESFFPTGTYQVEEGMGRPNAFFTGHVQSVSQRINPLTGEDFYWLKVQTFAFTLDVIISPLILDRPITEGSIIYCDATLFGKIYDEE